MAAGAGSSLALALVSCSASSARLRCCAAGAVAVAIAAVAAALRRGSGHWDAGGLAYAALSGISLALLRGDDSAGLLAILFLFAVVWATDILAYFVGRAVGGPKLAPSISPGKTRSGALGGAVGGRRRRRAAVGAGGCRRLAALLVVVALVLSVVSQAGDLFESWVKRRHGVKDSGGIIPGSWRRDGPCRRACRGGFALYYRLGMVGGVRSSGSSALFRRVLIGNAGARQIGCLRAPALMRRAIGFAGIGVRFDMRCGP